MKRSRMILVLCCICIVLLFTLFMSKYCAKQNASEPADPGMISIDTMAEEAVEQIHWGSAISGNHTLKKNGAGSGF